MFDAFTQADTSTTREYGGTGLGLSISKQYIELMNGKISIESRPKKGTKISVSLPLTMSKERPIRSEISRNAVIVCSEESTAEMIGSHLELLGWKSQVVEAISFESSPELLLIDAEILDSNPGITKKIRSQQFENGILCTKLNQSRIDSIFDNWQRITKPLTRQSLRTAIKKYSALRSQTLAPSTIKTGEKGTEKLSILVAEDVETNQKIICEMLSMFGHSVDIAENGLEALNMFEKKEYDLIFMDCQMPVMDGFEATQKIRRLEKRTGDSVTPIIALTAGLDKKDRQRCAASGMNHYVGKPFSISDIRNALEITTTDLYDHKSELDNEPNIGFKPELRIDNENDTPIINRQAISAIVEIEKQTGNKILPEIFDGYKSQMESKIVELNKCIRELDFEGTYKSAHAIKSMSANVGAQRVHRVSSMLEIQGKEKRSEQLDSHSRSLDGAYQEFILEFQREYI